MNNGSKRWLPSSLHLVYMEATERRNYPYYIILGYMPLKGTLGNLVVAPSDGCLATAPYLASTQALQSQRMSSFLKATEAAHIIHQSDPCSSLVHQSDRPSVVVVHAFVFGLGFVAQPRNPVFLW
jgi:hypothetical protein